jgi:hypothetical protein
MRNALVALAVCVGLQFWSGCGEDKGTNEPNNVPHYNLSGTVLPLYYGTYGQLTANDVTLVFIDSELDTVTVITDSQGYYEVTGLAGGEVEISMFSADTLFRDFVYNFGLPAYLPTDTTISLSQDSVINLEIRRLEPLFMDFGTTTDAWLWEYGVKNEDGKYIFWFDIRGSDMRMANNVHVPEDIRKIGFILLGEAAPSYTSTMRVYLYINGVLDNYYYSRPFSTTESYWIEPLYSWYKGDDIRLKLQFEKTDAEFIYIKRILLYIY